MLGVVLKLWEAYEWRKGDVKKAHALEEVRRAWEKDGRRAVALGLFLLAIVFSFWGGVLAWYLVLEALIGGGTGGGR